MYTNFYIKIFEKVCLLFKYVRYTAGRRRSETKNNEKSLYVFRAPKFGQFWECTLFSSHSQPVLQIPEASTRFAKHGRFSNFWLVPDRPRACHILADFLAAESWISSYLRRKVRTFVKIGVYPDSLKARALGGSWWKSASFCQKSKTNEIFQRWI